MPERIGVDESGDDVGFHFCAPPSVCYMRCRQDKGAKGGKYLWGDVFSAECLCDFCSDVPIILHVSWFAE